MGNRMTGNLYRKMVKESGDETGKFKKRKTRIDGIIGQVTYSY